MVQPAGSAGKRHVCLTLSFRSDDITGRQVEFVFSECAPPRLVACNRKIGTSCSLVGAVYDRPQSRKCDIVGGHRPPLQKTAWSRFICYRPLDDALLSGSVGVMQEFDLAG